MKLLRTLFGDSKEEIWRQLAEEIQGTFVDGGFWNQDKVEAHYGDWKLVLDTYTVSSGKSSTTYTRMRAPFFRKDGFYFRIYRKGIFSGLGKWLGMQDIEVSNPEFDESFIIQGNDERKVKALFANPTIQQLIRVQPDIHFEIKDSGGFWGPAFPENVDQLYFEVYGVLKDQQALKALYLLFAEVLNQLCLLDSAYEGDPGIDL